MFVKREQYAYMAVPTQPGEVGNPEGNSLHPFSCLKGPGRPNTCPYTVVVSRFQVIIGLTVLVLLPLLVSAEGGSVFGDAGLFGGGG